MNEMIDIAFTGAKVMTWKNKPASIVVHGLSVAYNIGQMTWYRMQYLNQMSALANGGTVYDINRLNGYKQEMYKHAFLTGLDCLVLFLTAMSGMKEQSYCAFR